MTADGLESLWASVAPVALARVQVLEDAVRALEVGAAEAPEACARAYDECHKLVGSLDSWGRTGGSALALRAAQELEAPVPDRVLLRGLAQQLRQVVVGGS